MWSIELLQELGYAFEAIPIGFDQWFYDFALSFDLSSIGW